MLRDFVTIAVVSRAGDTVTLEPPLTVTLEWAEKQWIARDDGFREIARGSSRDDTLTAVHAYLWSLVHAAGVTQGMRATAQPAGVPLMSREQARKRHAQIQAEEAAAKERVRQRTEPRRVAEEKALAELPPMYQRVLLLSRSGFSIQSIARELNITPHKASYLLAFAQDWFAEGVKRSRP